MQPAGHPQPGLIQVHQLSASVSAAQVAAVNGSSPAAARLVQAATVPAAIGVPNSSASRPAVRATGKCWPRHR